LMLGFKRLFFDRILERSYWIWRRHPILMVPTMLGTGLSTIEQSVVTMATVAFLNLVAGQGLLKSFATRILSGSIFGAITDPSIFPLLVVFATISLVGYALVGILGGGFVYSAEYGVYVDAWQKDSVSFSSLLANGALRWKAMAWTIFLTVLVTWSPLILVGIVTLLVYVGTGNLVAAALSFVVVYEFAIGASLLLSLFTLYAYPAVVVDQVSGFAAIRRSFRVASHNLGTTMTYSVVRGAFQLLLAFIVILGAPSLPLTSLTTAVVTLLLLPILHSTKTMIYHYARPDVAEMEFRPASPIIGDMYRRLPKVAWRKVKNGLFEIGGFLESPSNFPFHVAAILALAIGIVDGNYITNGGLGAAIQLQPGYDPRRGNPNVIFPKVLPPFLGIDLFLHNWLVSVGTALSGIGFGFPSFADILFNGFILGIVQPLTPSNTLFLAAILPHGIIEIPSLVIAGSVGIKLGVAAWRAKLSPSPESTETLSQTLRQAVYVVVGLAVLFLIAGLIEADITPIIMRMYGWTF
jgi:uncharacterized membrane protein SpoIIM required for sporulation